MTSATYGAAPKTNDSVMVNKSIKSSWNYSWDSSGHCYGCFCWEFRSGC